MVIQKNDQQVSLSPVVLQLYGEKDIRTLMNLLRLKEPEAYIHSLRVATLMDDVFVLTKMFSVEVCYMMWENH